MRFEKDSKERAMFGSLNTLVKNYITKDKCNRFALYLSCVEFGQKYIMESDIDSVKYFAHNLAFEFMNYVISNKEEKRKFTFEKGTIEYDMCLEFYKLCQMYWLPVVASSEEETEMADAYWEACIQDFTEFSHKYRFEDDSVWNLPYKWAQCFLEKVEKQSEAMHKEK